MSRAWIYSQLDRDLEDGLRILGALHDISRRMVARSPDAMAAADYDATHGVSVAWCDTHEREVEACRRKLLPCRGVPLPRYSDRTGDEVVGTVLQDAWDMQDGANLVHAGMEAMRRVARRYGRDEDPRAATTTEEIEDDNRPKCQNHMRHGWLIDAMGKNPTRVHHRNAPILEADYRLCRWCIDTVRSTYIQTSRRELPNGATVDQHAKRQSLPRCNIPAAPGDENDVEKWIEEQRRHRVTA